MKSLTTKQEARLENKKKKMAALTDLMKLNDNDRKKKHDGGGDGDELSSNSNSENNQIEEATIEPIPKRVKRSNESETSTDESSNVKQISQTDYIEMKKKIHEKRRRSRSIPKLRLKSFGEMALLTIDSSKRTPLFLTDIQHLIMFSMLGSLSPYTPSRWCHIEKSSKITHTVVLILEGLSLYHFSSYESLFKQTTKIFKTKFEVVMPPHQDGQIVEELANVPVTEGQRKELIDKYGSLEAAVESTQNQMLLVKQIFPVLLSDKLETSSNEITDSKKAEIIPRKQLLLSALQMVDEDYPLPLRGELANRYINFVMTKDHYTEVTNNSPMFGVDCEMCLTANGCNELTRISVVNEQYKCIYETFVLPETPIVNYLTPYSGITAEMLASVTKTLRDVQKDLRELFPSDAILVGQSLNCDLFVMKMMHPYVIDTSLIYNISGDRKIKSKLKTLSHEFLGETIQNNPLGHDSIEDAVSSLKLAQLKLKRGIDFGDAVLSRSKYANEKQKLLSPIVTQPSNNNKKSITIISSMETNIDYSNDAIKLNQPNYSPTCIQTKNNKNAIRKTQELAVQNNLCITHLRIVDHYLEETKIKNSFARIDRWIGNVWNSVAPNGLFIVLLGDQLATAGGAALIEIKQNNVQ